MANYLELNAGRIKEKAAINTSSGATDAGKIVELDTAGKIDSTMMPTGIGADSADLITSEDLAGGDFINIYDDGGVPTVRKADAATEGKEAVAFVKSSSLSGENNTVFFEGTSSGHTGLTIGSRQYLDATTAGGSTETPPSTSANVVQYLGLAISATEISFEATDPITVA